jgi:phosphotransferase system enzyme I (PtsI)
MARALGIPAVVGLKRVTKWVKTGEEVIIDGNHGIVIIDPNEATRRIYEDKIRRFQKYEKELLSLSTLPCQTLDGHRIELACNIELPEEVNLALSYGTDIVGLMRTEFLYLKSDTLPTEEEQFEIYKNIATKTTSVTIRTLDLGGDKLTKYIERGIEEVNPALGCRGIRFSLSRRDIFIDQLKAIIRASAYGNVKILLPMVHEVDEVRKVKSCINKAFSLIKKTNAPCPDTIEIGVMIEIPSAVFVTSAIAKEVDFFSIGSNDLTQYTLACDRTNSRVSQIYNPLHPAVLRLIRYTTDASHGARKWVGCCGELASYPPAIPILIGLGVDELSVAPIYILEVKKIIRALSMDEARIIADEVSGLRTNKEVKKYIKRIKERIPVIKEIMEKREYKDM